MLTSLLVLENEVWLQISKKKSSLYITDWVNVIGLLLLNQIRYSGLNGQTVSFE